MIKTKLKKRGKIKKKTDEPDCIDILCIVLIIFVVLGSILVQHLPL